MSNNMTGSTARELHFYLTLEQSSLILEALVEQPFKVVFDIIGQLNHQVQQFYQADADHTTPALFVINAADFSICIKALGELPYNRVCQLVNYLHQQLQTQQAPLTRQVDGTHQGAAKMTTRDCNQ
jgi:DNA phosphorothioation-dependent restriction protein DptG